MRALRGTTLAVGVLVATLVPVLSGCGSQGAHSDVAGLSARLDQVDQALSSRSFAEARSELAALTVQTRGALSSGDLTTAKAAPILSAISALTATLPAPARVTPAQTATQGPQQPQDPGPPKKHHDNGHHGNDNQGGD